MKDENILSDIIPALERASGLKASDFKDSWPDSGLTMDEWAALWMARAIMEKQESGDQIFTLEETIEGLRFIVNDNNKMFNADTVAIAKAALSHLELIP